MLTVSPSYEQSSHKIHVFCKAKKRANKIMYCSEISTNKKVVWVRSELQMGGNYDGTRAIYLDVGGQGLELSHAVPHGLLLRRCHQSFPYAG